MHVCVIGINRILVFKKKKCTAVYKQTLPRWRPLWPGGRVSPEVAADASEADVWRHQD